MKVYPIPLTGRYGLGLAALVDEADYEAVSLFSWHGRKEENGIYAETVIGRMQVYLMQPPLGFTVDHINHDTLDNRRENLRICTLQQNNYNRRPARGCASAFKGVIRYKDRWKANIYVDNKPQSLGIFDDEIAAALAYDEAAFALRGEFAYLNFPRATQKIDK